MYGTGELSLSDVQADFPFLIQLVSKYRAFDNTKPIIYYFVDEQIELIAYALAYPYPASIFEIYQIIKLLDRDMFMFTGK